MLNQTNDSIWEISILQIRAFILPTWSCRLRKQWPLSKIDIPDDPLSTIVR